VIAVAVLAAAVLGGRRRTGWQGSSKLRMQPARC